MIRRVQLVVTGLVQGVWFRASMQREARRLGLCGWVRNRPDGAVEAEAEGDSDAIAGLILWAQTGPSGAQVERVSVQALQPTGGEADFALRR
jgi:acylphosphatase